MKKKPPHQQVTFLMNVLRANVKAIVEHEDAVHITYRASVARVAFAVKVHPDDAGLVIGDGGATADAIRRIVWVACKKTDMRVDMEFYG